MSDKSQEAPNLRVVTPIKTRRRNLPSPVRYFIIAAIGALLAYGVYYGLNKLGY
jgi:hypothetical protein